MNFSLDSSSESIHYTTTRCIDAGEELCIFYGAKLWFETDRLPAESTMPETAADEWGGLTGIEATDVEEGVAIVDGVDAIVPEDQLPFKRLKITPDDEEEDANSLQTREFPPSALHDILNIS